MFTLGLKFPMTSSKIKLAGIRKTSITYTYPSNKLILSQKSFLLTKIHKEQ